MNIELLLTKICEISNKYDLINQKTGSYFNIFDIANISTDEVTICRVIHELLDPKGSHYQGDLYLRLFVEHVLNLDFTESDYKNVRVHREYIILGNRRIDLVIESNDELIPIEVKIYAGDQNNQCFDYYNQAKNSKVFYLTLHGSIPSSQSAGSLTPIYNDRCIVGYEEIVQLSFENDILSWLNRCLEQQETIRIASIREIILQLILVIRRITNLLVEDKEVEISNIISSSKSNMQSAIEIEKSLKACKIKMIKKVLNAIEERIDKANLNNANSYDYNDFKLVNVYYDKKGSSYPGISYYIKNIKDDIDLWLRIEIDSVLFVGFCTPCNNVFNGKMLANDEIRDVLPNYEPEIDGWWIYWEYLPEDNESECPNFKEFNDAYFDLFDEDKFDEFIDRCVYNIEKLITLK
ncbi:PD-(D/E)XK nuclease family protein [Romboutsia sedimentorum]|uniref:PD-(D/E)XK nuclease family protein n=1 Tax=Romboutsia sedimentorum TaxID=1368474 RepID=A0ABT7E8B3_9FIRM|nr:PD-(D/E)XK nuclease family protein [Romboutsia sedimentorum]MDK2562942.1 PD-(D/E)XK nuclease family protein [Romboutsia sedimentorum]